jgi:hypothetical protein
MAGETVFTATSQGANNFTPDVLLLWENLYKYVVCHVLCMTYVLTGILRKQPFA